MSFFANNWPTPLDPVVLQGRAFRLEPLAPRHEAELLQISQDEEIWRYLTSYGGSPRAMHAYVDSAMRDYQGGIALPFVVRCLSNEQIVGMTRLKNISQNNRKAVIGSWFALPAWGTGANTESKLLLLGHAFEALQCLRIEFQTDSRNLRSRAALRKIGAIEEGTLRSYLITREGSRRDTVVFSVLDKEWPEVKQRLLARLRTISK